MFDAWIWRIVSWQRNAHLAAVDIFFHKGFLLVVAQDQVHRRRKCFRVVNQLQAIAG